MATNIPQDDFHKTGLRLPKELHAALHEAALASGRSYNSEIVARLEATFESVVALLPQPVQEAIAMEIADNGGTEAEALTRLVLAGQVNGGTFLYATISPKTTFEQFTAMLEAGKKIIPPDAVILMERG